MFSLNQPKFEITNPNLSSLWIHLSTFSPGKQELKRFQCSDFNLESFDPVAFCPIVQAEKGGHSLCISPASCLSLSLSSKLSVPYCSLSPQDPFLSWPFLFVEPAGIWVIWSIITAFWPTSGILPLSNPPVLIFDG